MFEVAGTALACTIVYFLPTFVACARRSPLVTEALLVNALAGWTVAGWAAAWYLAFRRDTRPADLPGGRGRGPGERQIVTPAYPSLAGSWLSGPVADRVLQDHHGDPGLN